MKPSIYLNRINQRKIRHMKFSGILRYKRITPPRLKNRSSVNIHKAESVSVNEMLNIFCYFEIQTDRKILPQRPDRVLIIKIKCIFHFVDFSFSTDHRVKMKESGNRQTLGSCQKADNAMKHEGDGYINNSLCTKNSRQKLRKRPLELWVRGRIQTTALLRSAKILRRVLET